MKPKAIDLFSGCGGLTLGLTQAGFRVVGAVENDPLAVETYKSNHKRVVIWEQDIRKLSGAEVMRRLKIRPGQLDLLAGCPPCQGFSTMTTLNGRIGQNEQNDLVFEFLRFVKVLRPKTVMLENVPKLARNRRFKKLRSNLQMLGYEVNHGVLNAANYGVPQRRRRLILVAGKGAKIPFGSGSMTCPRAQAAASEEFKRFSPAGPLNGTNVTVDDRHQPMIGTRDPIIQKSGVRSQNLGDRR
jgi:DNA (cytosine-5)-methyltransferase 1